MRTLPIGDERVGASTTGDELVVRSPYDGHEIDRVPACGADEVERAVAPRGRRPQAGPLPAVEAGRDPRPRRAAPRRAHRGVRPHHRRGGGQADQDRARRGDAGRCRRSRSRRPRRARWPARWCRSTRPTSARASSASRCALPIGVVGAISPFNFPLNLVAHKVAPAIAAGCPVVLKPASQTPLSAIALAELLLDECGLPAGHLNVVTGSGGDRRQRDRRPPRHRDHHLHRFARRRLGHPRRARRARRSGSSSATTRR